MARNATALDVIVSIGEESGWIEMEADLEKLWANPTLGAAANGVFLDVMEAQLNENRAAEVEGRPARIAKRDQRFPGWEQGKDISSNYSDVQFGQEFDDGEPVNFPQGGPEVPSSGNIARAKLELNPPPAKKAVTRGVKG